MKLAAEMSNDELREALRQAVEASNWHFMDQNWRLAEWWHLRAVELQAAVDRRGRQ